ncbi:MAG: hypothetical protein ACKOTD_05395, partial [Phycisphaerales bacterium]
MRSEAMLERADPVELGARTQLVLGGALGFQALQALRSLLDRALEHRLAAHGGEMPAEIAERVEAVSNWLSDRASDAS